LGKNTGNSDNRPEVIYDSRNLQKVSKPVASGLPKYYFPLIIGIVLIEAVVLVLVLLDIIPIKGPFEIYPTAGYFSYIGTSDLSHIAVTITRWFFFLLTAGVMIPVTIIIMLEIGRKLINSLKKEDERVPTENVSNDKFQWLTRWLEKLDKSPRNPNLGKERIQGEYITRFDTHQRIQHYLLFISFILLFITGMLRGFPHWPTFSFFTTILGGPDFLRLIHDIAAFVMIVDCIYHIWYIAYGYFVQHKAPLNMLPNLKDLKDLIHTFLWILGIYKTEPEYTHFQYGQKIDYWAIFWGMPVMVITGIIMMFPAFFSQWFGGQWFAVTATAHRDEAVLATSFIIIVHMYYGHFATNAFPVNTVMFTGKMLKSKYKEWFGREYEELTHQKDSEKRAGK
jgi:formate dehydrogenase subunit gamma